MLNVDPCGMATTLLKVHTIQDANKMLMLIAQIFFWSFNIIQPEVGEVGLSQGGNVWVGDQAQNDT